MCKHCSKCLVELLQGFIDLNWSSVNDTNCYTKLNEDGRIGKDKKIKEEDYK